MSESSLCTFQGPNGVWLSSASLLLDVGGMHVNYPRLWQLRELDNPYLSTSSPVHGCTIRQDTGQDDSIMHLVTWLVGMAFTRQDEFKTNKSPASSFGDGNSSWTSKDASAVSRHFRQYHTLRSVCAGTSLFCFFKTASPNDFIFDVNVCIKSLFTFMYIFLFLFIAFQFHFQVSCVTLAVLFWWTSCFILSFFWPLCLHVHLFSYFLTFINCYKLLFLFSNSGIIFLFTLTFNVEPNNLFVGPNPFSTWRFDVFGQLVAALWTYHFKTI